MTEPVVVVREIARPVEDVWALCTTPEGLQRWWWPMFTDTVYEIDARVLHTYRFATVQGGIGVKGDYIVVDKFNVLEFSWDWDGEDVTDHVRVVMLPSDVGTSVTLTHTITEPSQQAHDNYVVGWNEALDRLVNLTD